MRDDDDSEYSISDSLDSVGYVYPCIVDFHNRIIDGRIRLKQDPDWPTYGLSHIETMAEFLLARIIANLHRRKLSDEEITGLLKELAEEIVSVIGKSHSQVYLAGLCWEIHRRRL